MPTNSRGQRTKTNKKTAPKRKKTAAVSIGKKITQKKGKG